MGLAIGVGMLAEYDRTDPDAARRMNRDLDEINAILDERDLPRHHEPETFDEPPTIRASMSSFPYSWLHYLRRFAAHAMRDPKWVPYPVEPGEDPADDPVLLQMYRQFSSHLLCHSDSQGYYLPIDFEDLLFDQQQKLPGDIVGSSHRLCDELLAVSDHLEIAVDECGGLTDEEVDLLARQRPSHVPFARERLVWLALFEAARASIEHDTAIVFY